MSDSPHRPATSPQSESGAKRKPRGSAARRPRRVFVKGAPPSDPLAKPPLWRGFLLEIRNGSPGYLASLIFHVMLLAALLLILAPDAYQLAGGDGGAFLDLELVSSDDDAGRTVPERRPIREPIDEFPVKPVRKKPALPKKQGHTGKKTAGQGPRHQPVKPVDVKSLFANRKPELRERIFEQLDPEEKIRRAIVGGLEWLKRQQKSSGYWRLYGPAAGYPDPGEWISVKTLTGATSLALLAFLGDGHTHKKPGRYQKTVADGLKWLLGVQKPNGDFHDSEEQGRQASFYAHSQATIVVCEAFAMTGDETLREPAERAVRYLVESQNPEKGGWKYRPQEVTSKGDLSVTGWALMALHSARSSGIAVPDDAFRLAGQFLDSVQERDGALYKYEPLPSRKPVTPTMTAEGLLCRQFLGWPKDHPALLEGVAYLNRPQHKPRWVAGGLNRPHVYYWYYAGHVLHNLGGKPWKTWYGDVSMMIVGKQNHRTGLKHDVSGSWDPKNAKGAFGYGKVGGRLYMTAMCLLVLELPIRHRSIYDKRQTPQK